jgi:uncharacterized membrane protein YccC
MFAAKATIEHLTPGPIVANDWVSAAAAGARTALAVAFVSAFWIAADWPSGVTATILSSVVAARLAIMERAATVALAGTLIFALVPIPGFVLLEVLLPYASDFQMFVMIVGPAIFFCAYLMGNEMSPLRYLVGFLCGLYMPSVAGFQDRIGFDAIGFINTSIAAVFAAIAAVFAAAVGAVLFVVVAPETREAARKRFARFSCRVLSRTTVTKEPLRPSDLENAMIDILQQFGSGGPDPRDERAVFEGGVALLAIGRGCTWLRARLPGSQLQSVIETEISAFARSPDVRRLEVVSGLARGGAAVSYANLQDGTLSSRNRTELVYMIGAFMTIGAELERLGALVLQQDRLGSASCCAKSACWVPFSRRHSSTFC